MAKAKHLSNSQMDSIKKKIVSLKEDRDKIFDVDPYRVALFNHGNVLSIKMEGSNNQDELKETHKQRRLNSVHNDRLYRYQLFIFQEKSQRIFSGRLADCCGIAYGRNLYHIHPYAQAEMLIDAMIAHNVRQLVITDAWFGPENMCTWKQTKDMAIQGPVTYNPNSENNVCHWTVLPEMIMNIAQSPLTIMDEKMIKGVEDSIAYAKTIMDPSSPLKRVIKDGIPVKRVLYTTRNV